MTQPTLSQSLFGWFSGGGQANPTDYGMPAGIPEVTGFNIPGLNGAGSRPMGSNIPGAAGMGTGLGMNVGTGQLALSGLGALGNLYSAFQAQGLAKKQFDLTSNLANANLANQIKSYNTSLSDKARARGAQEGQSQGQVDAYVRDNSMSR